MLTEIYCESFGDQKRIPFSAGLNVIQGLSGNSIGKSTALKIIDFAFGGQYYADSNDDVIKHIGDHDICFTHTFNGCGYYFRRNAKKYRKVQWCKDASYEPYKETPSDEFCEFLFKQYQLESDGLSFRDTVSLYSRIWNKPNKEVSRPLYNHSFQTVKDAIISLVRLFNEYGPISELNEQDEYLRKRAQVLTKAVNYHFLKVPTKEEYTSLINEKTTIQRKITQLRQNISVASVEKADALNDQYSNLIETRTYLLRQQGRVKRALSRCTNSIAHITTLNKSTFSQLLEFFPEINMQRISEVQGFHDSLHKVLLEELTNEEKSLTQDLDRITLSIQENEIAIQQATNLPTKTNEAMDLLFSLLKKQEQIQSQIGLYNDKVADAAQKAKNKESLAEMLTKITTRIESRINAKITEYSQYIMTSNSKAPSLQLSDSQYFYGVEDNTGTGKAYTDLILFDLAILSLTTLPILIHDSFLFNNIDDLTKQSFLRLYSQFPTKQIFISLDTFLGADNKEIDNLLYNSTRLVLSENKPLFGKDWRTL